MFIYTGNAMGEKLDAVKDLGLGIMLASSSTCAPRKDMAAVPCALDNGAFQCWRRGYPFMADVFLKTLDKAYACGIALDFIVCPDMVARGKESLDFSMTWATGRLASTPRLALVVQDGLTPEDVYPGYHLRFFSHLFIGGTVEWKWRTAKTWIEYAHSHKKKCHIGQVGTFERLVEAERLGADSVDSTSFVRNESWDVIRRFRGGTTQGVLWDTKLTNV